MAFAVVTSNRTHIEQVAGSASSRIRIRIRDA